MSTPAGGRVQNGNTGTFYLGKLLHLFIPTNTEQLGQGDMHWMPCMSGDFKLKKKNKKKTNWRLAKNESKVGFSSKFCKAIPYIQGKH